MSNKNGILATLIFLTSATTSTYATDEAKQRWLSEFQPSTLSAQHTKQ